MMQELW